MGMISVRECTSADEVRAAALAAAAVRKQLYGNPPKCVSLVVEPEPKIEIKAPVRVFHSWPVHQDAHVYAWRVAEYERQIKSLQMALENKERAISRMIGGQDIPHLPRVTANDVCKDMLARCAVDGLGNYTMSEILGPRRDRRIIEVRHRCVSAVVRKCPHLSYIQIGRFFNRDHASIMSAARKMGALR